jgi:hypothetical protein
MFTVCTDKFWLLKEIPSDNKKDFLNSDLVQFSFRTESIAALNRHPFFMMHPSRREFSLTFTHLRWYRVDEYDHIDTVSWDPSVIKPKLSQRNIIYVRGKDFRKLDENQRKPASLKQYPTCQETKLMRCCWTVVGDTAALRHLSRVFTCSPSCFSLLQVARPLGRVHLPYLPRRSPCFIHKKACTAKLEEMKLALKDSRPSPKNIYHSSCWVLTTVC